MRLSISSQFVSAALTGDAASSAAPTYKVAARRVAAACRAAACRASRERTPVLRSVECGWRMTNDTIPPPPAAPLTLIDIGINLGHDSYDSDRDGVITRAQEAGVVQMMVTGASIEGTAKAIELARSRPGRLFATAGVHPHHASELTPDSLSVLEAFARQPEVVAAGECGLDYFR